MEYMNPCSAASPKSFTPPNHSFSCSGPFPATINTLFLLSAVSPFNKFIISVEGGLPFETNSVF